LNNVPCSEIYASISYRPNESLVFALWLLETQHTSRFLVGGNGGMAGMIDYLNMATQFNSGLDFAVAGGITWSLRAMLPAVHRTYIYGTHIMKIKYTPAYTMLWVLLTPGAKALVEEYYSPKPKYAYYDGSRRVGRRVLPWPCSI
jgi:hypothetical protein